MENIQYYIAIIAVIVIGVIVIKKISSCLWNTVVGIVMLAVLAWALTELGVI